MPKFAANLSMMFNEVPFLERFAAAAKQGFNAVEFLFPYEHPAELLAEKLRKHGLQHGRSLREGIISRASQVSFPDSGYWCHRSGNFRRS